MSRTRTAVPDKDNTPKANALRDLSFRAIFMAGLSPFRRGLRGLGGGGLAPFGILDLRLVVEKLPDCLGATLPQLGQHAGMSRIAGQVPFLVPIVAQVEQLHVLGGSRILDIFPSLRPDALASRALRMVPELFAEDLGPPSRRPPPQERSQAAALDLGRDGNPGQVHEGRSEVDVQDHVPLDQTPARVRRSRVVDDERDSDRQVVHQPFVGVAPLAQKITVVRGVDDDRVPVQSEAGGLTADPAEDQAEPADPPVIDLYHSLVFLRWVEPPAPAAP